MSIVGTCSICGGAVEVPDVWHGIHPPTPQCSSCHAVAATHHEPVIPMRPIRTADTTTLTSQCICGVSPGGAFEVDPKLSWRHAASCAHSAHDKTKKVTSYRE